MKLGKRPATYDWRDIRYADIRPAGLSLPKIPSPRGGFGTDFKNGPTAQGGWGMLGNGPCDDGSVPSNWAAVDGAGDCAWAGPAHEIMEAAKNAGRPIPAFSCKTVLEQYAAYAGYDPQTGANDQGSNVREVLSWRQKNGLKDDVGHLYKIGAYVSLEPGNQQQLWEALFLFEAVGIGFEFPSSAMDQFNQGRMWSVVPGATVEGGHYVPLVGHPTANIWTCVTWGQRQTMTPQFLAKYNDEAWAWVDPLRYSQVTGKDYEGYKDADLEQYIKLVGGSSQS